MMAQNQTMTPKFWKTKWCYTAQTLRFRLYRMQTIAENRSQQGAVGDTGHETSVQRYEGPHCGATLV